MLPLSVIKAAISNPIQVELKNGETFNGYLKGCDVFMNLYITDVIRTSKDGETFYRLAEAHIRGTMIKLLNIPDEVMEKVKDEEELKRNEKRHFYGRGRGRGHANEGNEEGGRSGRWGRGGQEGGRGGRGGYEGGRGGRGGYEGGRGGRGGRGRDVYE
eukprot:CAMPEP_0175083170 /NCGR_PEP_ID=MMETSP0052_2-20121109/27195_1 /TAXON_ID=51329 ORGANISM="Polytomella parva, Strain SAG 63-3" /NCGR_SAMPLE_ID=MMETSP0052_2 /ASSEMBLY_ACC=CAM_ASM_000194 /LENGTH=157 /DNA_ID=CAMNT_0016354513 /DNA_START=15 /DNA_END=488 /DNA_ORIENTATION=-